MRTVPREEFVKLKGTRLDPGPWLTLDQPRINAFADCTEDRQFIHVDETRAAETALGGTVAHGFLTLSMLVRLSEDARLLPEGMVMGLNYGLDKVRFLAPVRAGKRVRVQAEIAEVTPRGAKRFLVKQAMTVEIEGEATPALYAEWLLLYVCE